MRRNYISPEFDYSRVYGTFNMREQSSFFSSKMLEIEDFLSLDNQSLVYYQNINREQLNLSIENSLPSIAYSTSDDKNSNHTLVIDDSQTDSQKNSNTRYILNIDLRTILTNYLFATLKKYRTFEGVTNQMCLTGDVNFAIKEYIIKNILDRYKFTKVELYLKYNDLKSSDVLRFSNTWNSNIGLDANKLKRFQTETEFDNSSVKITFNQEQSSQLFSFDYYFKLYFEKL